MRIAIENLEFDYGAGGPGRFRLRIPELQIEAGARVAFVGPSGSGKTTLLRLLAGIVTPQSGTVTVGEVPVNELADAGRRAFRIRHIGFVFQDFRLVEHLDVRENILLPYRLNVALPVFDSIESQVKQQAERLDLADKLDSPVDELSQGEQQRVAICRALLPRPELLLADEPTGNLDPKNKDRILDQLFQQAESAEATLLMVTHDHALLDRFDRVIDFAEFQKPEAAHE